MANDRIPDFDAERYGFPVTPENPLVVDCYYSMRSPYSYLVLAEERQ